jgi:heptaprenylglyceryl phosphate synthase
MVNTTPVLGRNGSINIDGVEVGYVKGVTFSVDADVIKDYKFNSAVPAVLESGNQSYRFTFEKMYIDNTYATLVLNGTKVTIILGPANSTPVGQPNITLANAIIFHHGWRAEQEGIVIEDGSGEAATCTPETYT